MGYWIAGQVRTMMRSVVYKSKLSMGERIIGSFLMMPFAVFLRPHLRFDRSITLIVSGRDIRNFIGDAI